MDSTAATTPVQHPPAAVDLAALEGDGGVLWSASPAGLHANLVVLGSGATIGAHRNDDLDVLLVVLAGAATVTIGERPARVEATSALVIPRRAIRSITAGPDGVRYLTVHAARGPMTIASRGAPDV
jgi:quercetin dioxygenase-like cupin family protein